MNSGVITVDHNDHKIFIDDPEDFRQYRRWLISRQGGNTLQTTATQVSTKQLYGR